MEMPNTFKFYLNIAKTHVDVMTQSLFGFFDDFCNKCVTKI